MKIIGITLFTLLFSVTVFAQQQKGYVYLKNGTILKGRYQYIADSTKLQIESAGNIWIFTAAEIDRVSGKSKQTGEVNPIPSKNSLFWVRTELGVLAGNSENSQSAPFSFTSALNYRVTPKISTGLGIGVEFLKETYLPVYANFEYKFRDSWSTPYVFLKAGYQVPLEDANTMYNYGIQPTYYYDYIMPPWPGQQTYETPDTQGGFMINTGLGYQRMFSSGFGMSFAFGYQFHRLGYTGENDYQLNIDYNRLTIKLGFIFN
jgi:hypothetical protein